MNTHNLTIRIVADPNAGAITPEDGYWLTIEQVLPDEKITTGEAAVMIDALFDLTPCKDPIESGTEPVEEPPADMTEALDKIAEKVEVDLSACERRLTGTYQTDLKIVRSHPDIPYTLRLSVGEILETVLIESTVAENLDVKAASSVTLTMPVQSGLACTWLGTVIGPKGPIDPPTIKAAGNTLFWAGVATGTIRAEYASIHDVVTVEIPGLPDSPGSDRGEPQDSTALAFYHYQVFPCDITPPPDDNEATLAEVCGWGGGTAFESEEDEPLPEPTPPPEPVYGCIDYYPLAPFGSPVTEPWYYEQTCCVPGSFDGCRVRTSRLEGGKDLSEQTRIEMTADWPGPIEFIGLGPITPEGCGTRYEETKIIQHNCCDEVEPMAWDAEVSVEVLAPGTSGIVGVTGGAPPYHWSVRGIGFSLYNGLRDGITDTPYVRIYAGLLACGYATIEVSDGCSVVNDGVKATAGRWVVVGDYFYPSASYDHEANGFIAAGVNGYSYWNSGHGYSKGKYWVGLYNGVPGNDGGETWGWGTWAPGGQWISCFNPAGTTMMDPYAGLFELPLIQGAGGPLESPPGDICYPGPWYRPQWLSSLLAVKEWIC